MDTKKTPLPPSNCFGPHFADHRFVRWPIDMDTILLDLGLNQDRIAVLRCLVSFWSPKKNDDGDFVGEPTVWASASTIAKRLRKDQEWVESTLHELLTGVAQKKREPRARATVVTYTDKTTGEVKNRKPPKAKPPQKFPILLAEAKGGKPSAFRSRRYDLTPLWQATAGADVSDTYDLDDLTIEQRVPVQPVEVPTLATPTRSATNGPKEMLDIAFVKNFDNGSTGPIPNASCDVCRTYGRATRVGGNGCRAHLQRQAA